MIQCTDNARCIEFTILGGKTMADSENERSITVIPDMASISVVSEFFDSCLEEYAIPVRTGYSLKVVVDEIISNIVYYSKAKTAEIVFKNDADQITAVFLDDGTPYNPLENESPDVTAGLEEREIGGLGWFMVKKIAQKIDYAYSSGKNQMTVILSKSAKKKELSLEDFE